MKGMFYTNFYWWFETMLEDCDLPDLIQSVTQITRECYVGYVKWWMIQYNRIITVAPDRAKPSDYRTALEISHIEAHNKAREQKRP